MKRSTKKRSEPLSGELAQRMMRTHGLAAEIARCGGFTTSYVSKILHGKKTPSRRFFSAAMKAVERITGNMVLEILREQISQEVERRGKD